MTSPLNKVRSGDPLVIPASTFNAFVDVALEQQRRQHSTSRERERAAQPAGLVPVRNESGGDRGRFDVLGITGPVLTPTENLDAFKSRVVLHGGVPQAAHAGRFVILTEPIAASAIGRAFVDGVCPVRVEMDDESHGFADVAAGATTTLRSAASGTAQLLWVQPQEARDDPAIAWTIVRIGGGGGGGSSVAVMFAEVQSASGTTPPYLYALRQVTHQGGYSFGAPYGLEIPEAYNLSEIGSSGTGVAPIPVGDIVMFWPTGSGGYVFDRHWYRGTYG